MTGFKIAIYLIVGGSLGILFTGILGTIAVNLFINLTPLIVAITALSILSIFGGIFTLCFWLDDRNIIYIKPEQRPWWAHRTTKGVLEPNGVNDDNQC